MLRVLQRIYVISIYGFLYLPLVVIMLFAFHKGNDPTHWPPKLFTLDWFVQLSSDTALLLSLRNSIIVGVIAVSIAAVLGLMGALALYRHKFWVGKFFYTITMLPILVPGLVLGVALLIFFMFLKFELNIWTIIIGHVTFLMPVIMVAVLSRLERLSPNYEQASRDLGANAIQTFFLVTLPNIRTALIGALFFAFTLSFDNIVVTFFLTGFQKTLPLEFWGRIRFGLTPATNAVATIMVCLSVVLIVVANRFMSEE
jgi:spermidine/putrescine transport system permease protein